MIKTLPTPKQNDSASIKDVARIDSISNTEFKTHVSLHDPQNDDKISHIAKLIAQNSIYHMIGKNPLYDSTVQQYQNIYLFIFIFEFMGTAIDFVDRAELLGLSICCDVKDRNINGSVQKFYCKVNSVLYDFKDIPCDVKTRLLDTYCLDLYGSQLWNYSKHDVNQFYVAWRRTIRRL